MATQADLVTSVGLLDPTDLVTITALNDLTRDAVALQAQRVTAAAPVDVTVIASAIDNVGNLVEAATVQSTVVVQPSQH